MRISLNWLKKCVKVPVSDEELVRLIGARLVEVEGVIDEGHKYDNIYIVKVMKAERIPDTHLTLCQIDCDKEELVQVVCGAPNVREGMLAVWIAPGAVVPASVHEDAPFVIGKRKMLGKYESNGMLAGADELDFGDDHSGIVEIEPGAAEPGELLSDVFDLKDLILEIENKSLTHRPDCFGLIGFAREVAGILGRRLGEGLSRDGSLAPVVTGLEPSSSVVTSGSPRKTPSDPSISISDPRICERYVAMVLEKHGEMRGKYLSWVDTVLSKAGMRPVDPIVDATNYLMLLTGQPLHAFDYDKFVAAGGGEKAEVVVRLAREGEKLKLLDGKEIELKDFDIVICSGEKPVALAGAMGGAETAIDENTRNIMVEAATFSLYNLRKTQMAHGIFSEAITRFTKGQPAYQCLMVAEACAEMLADGFRIAAVADKCPEVRRENVVKITAERVNGLLGTDYNEKLIVETLSNVGFLVAKRGRNLEITAPAWRTDIKIPEDVIEEVGRLLGYDNIKPVLARHGTAGENKMWALKREAREVLSRFGANEVLTYSFVSGKLLEKVGQDAGASYRIVNSISPELQYVRQSLVPSLLEKAYVNQKLPVDRFAIFEMNKVYSKAWGMDREKVPVERMNLGFVIAERKTVGSAFYAAKMYVERFLETFGIRAEFAKKKNDDERGRPFENKRAAEIVVGGEVIGVVGEFKNSVRRNFKLAEYLAGFEIDLEKVLEFKTAKKIDTRAVVEKRDLTVKWEKSYGELIEKIAGILKKYDLKTREYDFETRKYDSKSREHDFSSERYDFSITPMAIYQPETDKFISVHLEFRKKVDEKALEELEKLANA